MSQYRKIVWNEGMLLTPQHFQQFDNYHEELLNSRVRSVMQHEYGVLELRFSSEAIANGNFQINTCRAVMPDGLFVNVPDAEAVSAARQHVGWRRVRWQEGRILLEPGMEIDRFGDDVGDDRRNVRGNDRRRRDPPASAALTRIGSNG